MRIFTISLFILFSNQCFAQLWTDAKNMADSAASVTYLTESITELADSISDESELRNHLNEVKKTSSDIQNTLRDLQYTDSEINDIFSGSNSSTQDISNNISRTARRINRAKELVKKIAQITSAKPEAVTAAQTMEMNQTLQNIEMELQHQRMDREMNKDIQRSEMLKEKLAQKRKEAFFKRQFALMQDSSKTTSGSFFPFKTDTGENDSVSKHLPSNM